jgi:hypothetical protein
MIVIRPGSPAFTAFQQEVEMRKREAGEIGKIE